MIHQFNTLQEIIDFVSQMDLAALKSLGLTVVKTNGASIVQIGHEHLTPDLQAKLQDIEDKLKLKVQIAGTIPDPSHTYNFLAKDASNGHVYEFPQVWSHAEKNEVLDRLSRKVQISDQDLDPTHSVKLLVKDETDSHVHLMDIPAALTGTQSLVDQIAKNSQHIQNVERTVGLLGGSVPSSVMDTIEQFKAVPSKVTMIENALTELGKVVSQIKTDASDYMRLAPGNGDGNYQLIVQSPDGRFHATTDFDFDVLMGMMNREVAQREMIDWLMNRPMDIGVISGNAANDLSGAPTERFPKHPLITGDTISLKYPRSAGSSDHYIQDFVWLDGRWQAKHI